jgi:hypothetical protein
MRRWRKIFGECAWSFVVMEIIQSLEEGEN